MKILQLNITYGVGSTGKIVSDLVDVIDNHNDEAYVAYGYFHNDVQNAYKIKLDGKIQIALELLYTKITGYHGFTSKIATYKLIEWIKKINPDLIHLHNVHTGYINIRIFFDFLKDYNKPIVWTIHDCWSFTGHCSYYSNLKCDKWKTECRECPSKNEFPKKLFFDRSNTQYKIKKSLFTNLENVQLITPSTWLAKEVSISFLNKFPVKSIPNGINCNLYKYTNSNFKIQHAIENKKILLGVAANWSERKGLHIFEELANIISDEYIIVLIGLNNKQKNKVTDKILKIDRTNSIKELVEIYSSAFIYINASVQETMGMTTVEAMACGTPTIVFNATAVPEVVDEKTGYVVKTNDIHGILEGINYIEHSDIDYGITCPSHVKKNYNSIFQYQKYYELYQNIINVKTKDI